MALYKDDFVRIDLADGSIFRSFMNRTLGEGDIDATRFGVIVTRSGEAEDLTGVSCSGYFVRADGQTVVITGTVEDNKAFVTIPQSACAVEGNFSLAIKLVGSGVTGTMRIVDGTVSSTTTETVVDPGQVIPSIAELLAQIEACENATDAANAAAASSLGNFAPAFAQGTANAAGTYVTYTDGKVYLLPEGHTANTTWANTTKTAVTIGGEVSVLKSAIGNKLIKLDDLLTIPKYYIRPSDGKLVSSNNYRVSDFIAVTAGNVIKAGLCGTGTVAVLAFYTTADATGYTDHVTGEGATYLKEFAYTVPSNGYIRVCTNINNSDIGYLYFENTIPDNIVIALRDIDRNVNLLNDSVVAEVIPDDYVDGYIGSTGAISAQTEDLEITSSKIYDVSSIDFSLEFSESVSNWFAVASYDDSDALVGTRQTYSVTGTKVSGSYVCPGGASYLRFCFRTHDLQYTLDVTGTYSVVKTSAMVLDIKNEQGKLFTISQNWMRFKPCYDHLFVSTYGNNIVIPHESVYHVRLSKKLGFNVIEANVWPTATDGKYIVNHLGSGGVFGGYFHHVDGTTDISDIEVSTCTWDWIVANVRYNSTIPKYRTRPCLLEEFLSECRQQNIIPLITLQTAELVSIADKYMGKDNYIAYKSTKKLCPTAMRFAWVTKTTKEEILTYCKKQGAPFIYGMANPGSFTDSELRDIIGTLHKNGFLIGTSYFDHDWYKYSAFGFDANGTQLFVNRIETGNLCNIESIFGFDDFSVVGATEANGVLTFTSDGTITPNVSNTVYPVAMIDIQISFTGTITIPAIGEYGGDTYTSDGVIPVFVATPIINGSPALTISATSGTIITDCAFKASIA